MSPSRLMLWLVLLATVVAAIPAFPQAGEKKYNIPFNFNIGKEVRPAGPYVVVSVFGSSLLIRRADGTRAIVVSSMARESPDRSSSSKLVFRRYGNKCFLSEVWLGLSTGRELFPSDEEKEMARNSKSQDQVIVAEK